jgi:Ca2+-binding RTX toxin-like protein
MLFETLEPRQYMTSATFADGMYAVLSSARLTINLSTNGSNIAVVEDLGRVSINNIGTGESYAFNFANKIKILGNKKADQVVYQGNTVGAEIYGRAGNDTLTVTDLGTASSAVYGGDGADTMELVYSTHATVSGDAGNDIIKINTGIGYNFSLAKINVLGGGGNDNIYVYNGAPTVNGGTGTDILHDLSLGLATITKSGIESTLFI